MVFYSKQKSRFEVSFATRNAWITGVSGISSLCKSVPTQKNIHHLRRCGASPQQPRKPKIISHPEEGQEQMEKGESIIPSSVVSRCQPQQSCNLKTFHPITPTISDSRG
ncbi:hypothetical protein AVEN_208471-1 [Araneus ventricosus]|uniref:Uncharacterized protein n=1 Tax=Araneus ventricosus TaxID=182803 RepID=A0A4Y2P8N2_ARAVE|nr:hypothetical protein AVEN_208471-1 [Araneus ventricosus]